MTNSPPPGSEGPLERLLESLNRLGERLQSVVAAAFPNDADRSFLSGTEEELSEGSELGEGQSSSTAEVRGDVDETSADPNTEFSVDQINNASSQTTPNQDSTGSGAAGSSQPASNQESQNSGTATNASASSGSGSSSSDGGE